MDEFHFFESKTRPAFRIGWRMIKTAVAVFICSMIGYLRGSSSVFFSMIAAVLCMQPTGDQSLTNALNRTIGTIIGGILGAICLYLAQLTGMTGFVPVYYLIISLMLIPLIMLTLLIRKPSTSAISCVVFLSVTVVRISDLHVIRYAAERTMETLIGIAVALIINSIMPGSKKTVAGTKEAAQPLDGTDTQSAPPQER